MKLVSYSNDKITKFEVNEEALEFIRKIPKPLGVIAVAGTYRTGKSYLINSLFHSIGEQYLPTQSGIYLVTE